jgi:hypothetical protein
MIFDVLRKASFTPCSASALCSGLAQHVSDVLVHNETRDFR